MRYLVLTLLALAPLSMSFARRPAPDNPEVLEHMEGFKEALKTIATGFSDPAQREAVLAATIDFQNHAQAAKLLAPSNLDDVPEGERDAHVLAYRKSMLTLQRSLLDLEIKLLDGDAEGVMDMIRGELFTLRNNAHEAYQ